MLTEVRITGPNWLVLVVLMLTTAPALAQSGNLRAAAPPLLSLPSTGDADSTTPPGCLPPTTLDEDQVLGAKLLGLCPINKVKTGIKVEGQMAVPNKAKGIIKEEGKLIHSVIHPQSQYQGFLAPAGFCHRPTYFEENRLERYGQSRSRLLQPWVSGAKFGANLVALPYKMAVEPPRQCRFYDHPYEAGRVAPHYFEVYPADRRGALVEVATIAGLIMIIP